MRRADVAHNDNILAAFVRANASNLEQQRKIKEIGHPNVDEDFRQNLHAGTYNVFSWGKTLSPSESGTNLLKGVSGRRNSNFSYIVLFQPPARYALHVVLLEQHGCIRVVYIVRDIPVCSTEVGSKPFATAFLVVRCLGVLHVAMNGIKDPRLDCERHPAWALWMGVIDFPLTVSVVQIGKELRAPGSWRRTPLGYQMKGKRKEGTRNVAFFFVAFFPNIFVRLSIPLLQDRAPNVN
mmetsp:Transcript_20165/g.41552  ORF Transcript_20165/g.41552 Transcript_20165/m.41552 type:complete len:237 (+) Transcript_20165:1447-2157(+)